MTETGETVYRRTYQRPGETWPDTVLRVVDGNLALVDERYHEDDEAEKLYDMILDGKLIPAGRQLYMTGIKGRQFLYNCFVSGWTEELSEHFKFTFLRLMEGGGVGANYSGYVMPWWDILNMVKVELFCDPSHPDFEELRPYLSANTRKSNYWIIPDSREGWAGALEAVIMWSTDDKYCPDKKTDDIGVTTCHARFDLSNIRPRGSEIKTFGGTAAGSLPLAKLLHTVADKMNEAWLDGMNGPIAMDIDQAISECVVSGNVRRSARMSIMHWKDPYIMWFLKCKSDSSSHWSTNISVEIDDDFCELIHSTSDSFEVSQAKEIFRLICDGMLTNGEPGIWNSTLANIGEPNRISCTNPCVAGDTMIATVAGPRTIGDLAKDGNDVMVYSWHPKTKTPVIRLMRNPHRTASNVDVVNVEFDSGLVVKCTPDHQFYTFRGKKVKASNLEVGQSIRAFSASRDRSGHERIHGWDSLRNGANHQWTHRMLWECLYGEIPEGFVIAHLDNDGTNNDINNLSMMTDLEHRRFDMPIRQANGMDGHCPNHKVISVSSAGKADVFNGMVEDSHAYIILDPNPVAGHMSGIVSANCGEIGLEAFEACNLGHINLAGFVTPDGTVDYVSLYEAHRLMTRMLIRSTYGDVTDGKQKEVMDRNRRIGVGHLGFQWFVNAQGIKYSESHKDRRIINLLADLKFTVDKTARSYSHQLRIPMPVKTTTVAPTGSVAKLFGVSEGIQPIFARHFIRRIRFSSIDPNQILQVQEYKDKGYNVVDDPHVANTVIVEIASRDPIYDFVLDHSVIESAEQISMIDMLSVQGMYQIYWADNSVSFTVNVPEGSVDTTVAMGTIKALLGHLKGVTVMVDKSRPLSPYERITKEEFYDYTDFYNWSVESFGDGSCASGACPVR